MSKKRRISLITIIVIILLILLIIFFNRKNFTKKSEDYTADFEPTDYNNEDYIVSTIARVDIRMNYFIVRNAILQLYSNYETLNSEYSTIDEISVAENNIYNLLNNTYKKDKGFELEINKDEFDTEYTYNLLINDMYYIQKDDNNYVYIVYGTIGKISSTERKDFKYVVSCDRQYDTYSIIPDTQYVENIGLGNVKIGEKYNLDAFEDIERKGNINVFQETNINDDDYVNYLLLDLKSRMTSDREYTYNNLLVEEGENVEYFRYPEYKNNNFPTIDTFINYCKNNTKEFVTLGFSAYNKKKENSNNIYYCLDENNKSYTIIEIAPMKYQFSIE